MAWLFDNDQTDNSVRAHIGDRRRRSVKRRGSRENIQSVAEVLVTSQGSLELQKTLSTFGCTNTASSAGQFRRLVNLSIGVHPVRIIQCGIEGENLTLDGLVASRLSGKRFTRAANGKLRALQFGNATTLHASGASCITVNRLICRSTSTTGYRSRSKSCGRLSAISSSCAKSVTTSFTQGGM